jgi:hypothetical protein
MNLRPFDVPLKHPELLCYHRTLLTTKLTTYETKLRYSIDVVVPVKATKAYGVSGGTVLVMEDKRPNLTGLVQGAYKLSEYFAKPYYHKYCTEIHDVTTICNWNVCSFI